MDTFYFNELWTPPPSGFPARKHYVSRSGENRGDLMGTYPKPPPYPCHAIAERVDENYHGERDSRSSDCPTPLFPPDVGQGVTCR